MNKKIGVTNIEENNLTKNNNLDFDLNINKLNI